MPRSLLIQSEMLCSTAEEEPSDHAASVCQLPFSQKAPDGVGNEYAKVHPTLGSVSVKEKMFLNQTFKKQDQQITTFQSYLSNCQTLISPDTEL